MKLLILDKDFQAVDVVESFESFIWTDRYNQAGDFEIYLPVSEDSLALFVQGYYLWFDESDRLMIIETLEIKTDIEDGDHLTVTGSSLESILKRRIVWGQKVLTGSLQDAIETLLKDAIINPSDSNRKIDNFIFEKSTNETITSLEIDSQYTGDNLFDVIQGLCETNVIGFKVVLNDDNKFVFSLYVGEDRSYDQTDNDYIIFSPKFNNLLNSNYQNSETTLMNVALIGGEENDDKTRRYASTGSASGLDRREMFVDARDIRSEYTDDNGTKHTISTSEYNAQLVQRGDEKLQENKSTKSFEAEVETGKIFIYGEDYFMGDILQITNEYGIESKTRVTEMIHSFDTSGYSKYPTFTIIEDESEEGEE